MVPSDLELGTPSPHTADTISPQCISGRVRLLIARPVRRSERSISSDIHHVGGGRVGIPILLASYIYSQFNATENSHENCFTQKIEVSPCCAIADFFDRSLTRASIDNQRATATRSYPPIVKIEVVLFPKLFGALHLSPFSALAKCISTAEFAAWVPS